MERSHKKIEKHRFNLNVIMSCKNIPKCLIDEDIVMVKDMKFYTLREIAEYLGITYHIVVGIKDKKTENKGKKWLNSPLCPTITIDKI